MTDIPSSVRKGVYALAVATVASLVYVWSQGATWDAAVRMSPLMWVLFSATNGLFALFLIFTWRGYNWARWATIIWYAIWILAVLLGLLFSDAPSSLDRIVNSVIVAAEVWGCYQLLSKPASTWFRRVAAA